MAERTTFQPTQGEIHWKIHFRSNPQNVYEMLSTDEGRAQFWAEATEESGDTLIFHLLNEPHRIDGRVLERVPGRRYAVEYFAGSTATFEFDPDGRGGTDLTLTAAHVDERWRMEMAAGWVTVLLALKAAVDFGVDLRNHDQNRSWDQGFVDD